MSSKRNYFALFTSSSSLFSFKKKNCVSLVSFAAVVRNHNEKFNLKNMKKEKKQKKKKRDLKSKIHRQIGKQFHFDTSMRQWCAYLIRHIIHIFIVFFFSFFPYRKQALTTIDYWTWLNEKHSRLHNINKHQNHQIIQKYTRVIELLLLWAHMALALPLYILQWSTLGAIALLIVFVFLLLNLFSSNWMRKTSK